ncbi:hypothetical protein TSTA_033810 [Talaromyces stipitatus ATCC 10500]|uniref:GPI-anchored cell surface glycoprotein n=1 Tax=Talaromyces stipitatus (strain ATCC 10500 / CBS 375.48 / QM 6759 / NRRL 1006) TaxID=441959 RepID=B8M6R9_TALSN|nr:uncharacterized protein TSTA_033810 [Talaromyces stipitatus ATCC 10500]EED20139.1 hypothetical protein TSTA_033810 [Talaromyces stipitatus ATCC 10500]
MLVSPLLIICAASLVSIFSPWLKELQEPSLVLLQSASEASRDCVKTVFSDWLHISTTGTIRSPPVIISLSPSTASTVVLSRPWNGTKDYVLFPRESALATVTSYISSLSLVNPFKVDPPRFPLPSRRYGKCGSAVNGAVTFNWMAFCAWKRVLAKAERVVDEEAATAKPIEDLRRAKIVLGNKKESFLKGVLEDIDKISKESEASNDDRQVTILERLYYIEDPTSSSAGPTLFSEKRWTIAKSEFDSTYVWRTVLRVPSVDPSTVMSDFLVDAASSGVVIGEREQFRVLRRPTGIFFDTPKRVVGSSKRLATPATPRRIPVAEKSEESDLGGQTRPAVTSDVPPSARQFDNNDDLCQSFSQSTPERTSTVVFDFHVKEPSDPQEEPSVTEAVDDRQTSSLPSPSVVVDTQTECTAETNVRRRTENTTNSSTSVDIRSRTPQASEPTSPTDQTPSSTATSPASAVNDSSAGASSTDVKRREEDVTSPLSSVDIRARGPQIRHGDSASSSSPSPPDTTNTNTTNIVEPGDSIQVEGTSVANDEPEQSGSASIDSEATAVVEEGSSKEQDGYESSTSVQTAILTPVVSLSVTSTTSTTPQPEASSAPEETTPSQTRRRRNRMGQRQRRRLHELNENQTQRATRGESVITTHC